MSGIRFIPVREITDPVTVTLGLSGASGTGKTHTSMLVARGMAREMTGRDDAPFGFVDTENKRALHFRHIFPEMLHFDFKAADDSGKVVGFPPERWIAVIDAAEKANIPVLVIDSFSHEWEGVGGILDLHAQALDRLTRGDDSQREKRSQLAWAEVKPRHRRLIDRIVRAQCNIIICTRAKPVMQDLKAGKNARKTKTRREDVPWDPASDGDLMFEMTAMMVLDPSAPGCPVYQIKCADHFKRLFDPRVPMNVDTGRALAAWARQTDMGQDSKEAMDRARAEARKGTTSFRQWWNLPETKASWHHIRPILEELAKSAEQADKDQQHPDEDPLSRFAPTEDDLAEQEARALEAFKRESAAELERLNRERARAEEEERA